MREQGESILLHGHTDADRPQLLVANRVRVAGQRSEQPRRQPRRREADLLAPLLGNRRRLRLRRRRLGLLGRRLRLRPRASGPARHLRRPRRVRAPAAACVAVIAVLRVSS